MTTPTIHTMSTDPAIGLAAPTIPQTLMAEPLPTTTLAWLRQTAKFEGAVTAQVLLHLLERVEVLEAKDQLDAEAWASMRRASCGYQRRLLNLEAAKNLCQQDEDAELAAPTPEAAPVATNEELFYLAELGGFRIHAYRACYDLGREHGAQPHA
jgi:hypothetical protein